MTVVTKITKKARVQSPGARGLVAGANLRTPCGERRVENVRPGDLVVTRDNGLQPVRLVWPRSFSQSELAADPSLAPVCLTPRAVGPMMPQREIRVGGAHLLLIPGYRLADMPDETSCLVAAREIAASSDDAYIDRSVETVTYYNVIFDTHQIFCASGLPVESFRLSPKVLKDMEKDVSEDITRLFPEINETPFSYPPAEYPAPERPQYQPDFA